MDCKKIVTVVLCLLLQACGVEKSQSHAKEADQSDFFVYFNQYFFKISNWDSERMTPDSLAENVEVPGSRLGVYAYDPRSAQVASEWCPSSIENSNHRLFLTDEFALKTKGHMTKGTPKSSYRIKVKNGSLAGMKTFNLNSMWNDVSQMREALAWNFLKRADVNPLGHAFSRFCIDGKYFGLYSIVEHPDKNYLKSRFTDKANGNLYKANWSTKDLGPATLEYRNIGGNDSGSAYYIQKKFEDRTYELVTNDKDETHLQSYDDLAQLIKVLNGKTVATGFNSDQYRDAVAKVLDVTTVLKWAALNKLMGAWDNYYLTPSNFYLYNKGQHNSANFVRNPYFTVIPWDYDNILGITYDTSTWHDSSILDHKLPLVQNLLQNADFLRFYLDFVEWSLDSFYNEGTLNSMIDGPGGLAAIVSKAAFKEAEGEDPRLDYSNVAPHTLRQFTNHEVATHGFGHQFFQRGPQRILGIKHFVRMMNDSARAELKKFRQVYPRGSSGARFD